jgi:hypothetical protein
MRLRNEQLDAMSRAMLEDYIQKMVHYLRENLPGHCRIKKYQSQDLESLVRQGINEAPRYGITRSEDIQRFLECMVILGKDISTSAKYPWAGETLRRKDIGGSEKIEILSGYLLFGWEEPPNG